MHNDIARIDQVGEVQRVADAVLARLVADDGDRRPGTAERAGRVEDEDVVARAAVDGVGAGEGGAEAARGASW